MRFANSVCESSQNYEISDLNNLNLDALLFD